MNYKRLQSHAMFSMKNKSRKHQNSQPYPIPNEIEMRKPENAER